jgi:hypothetical protein
MRTVLQQELSRLNH